MDAIITSGPTDITSAPGTAETTAPEQTSGPENAASGTDNQSTFEPGSSQESADNSQGNSDQGRRWSKLDEIKELRAWRREARERESALQSQLEEMRYRLAQLDPRNQPRTGNPQRDPSKFWQDPEGSIEAKLEEKLERLQQSMFERFETTREQEYAQQALNQERQTAVEFIRSQQSYSPEDDEDLIEIIHSYGLSNLQPMQAAQAAWSIFQQMKGIGDRSEAKRRASGVIGQPPGVGLGKKIWSAAEYDQTLDQLMKNPKYLIEHPELEAELMSAQREGRVR